MTWASLGLTLLLAAAQSVPPLARDGDVVASTLIDVGLEDRVRLLRYVEIQPGDRFDLEAVRHAVELLNATGEFADVIVERKRGPDGIELIFRPVPAPLLRQIVVEGDAVVSAKKIAEITRLRDREPLWDPRLDRAASDVAQELAEKGFYAAQVRAVRRPAAHGTDAVFVVHSGPLARLGEVLLLGVDRRDSGLAGWKGPLVGRVYHPHQARDAAKELQKRLARGGCWKARVEVRVTAYDPVPARVTLAFAVDPGPQTSVEFVGGKVSGSLRERVEEILREGALKSDAQEEAAERLEEAFRSRGHRDASVSRRVEGRPDREVLVYEIHAGPVSRVASVTVQGAANARELEKRLATRRGAIPDDRIMAEDVRALTRALADEGHPDVRVDVEIADGGGSVPVVFRARPGPKATVRGIAIDAPAQFDVAARLHTRIGAPFRLRDLAQDRDALLSGLRDAGYPQGEVVPEVTYSPDRSEARIIVHVAPGRRAVVDHIVLAGIQATREEVILREMLVKEGDPLGLRKVLESQRRLGALGIFQKVDIVEMDPEPVDKRSLVVRVEEAPRTTVTYGVGVSERDLVRGSVEVTRRNLFGMDRTVSGFLRGSLTGNSRFLVTFREPYTLGHKQELFLTGFREEEGRDGFEFLRQGAQLQTARNLTRGLSLILRYTYQKTRLFNVTIPIEAVDRQFRNTTVSGPSVSTLADTRDDPLEPRRGRFVSADVQLSHSALGGEGFVKGSFQASAYRRLGEWAVLAVGSRVGLASTLEGGPQLPLPDRFFNGGDYGLRGYSIDTAGPLVRSTTGNLVPVGGNALLFGGAELRLGLPYSISAAVFSEAGNVYPTVSDVSLTEMLYTAGFGLRLKTPVGPLRVDWGYKLNRPPLLDGRRYKVHVALGHAF